MENKPTFEEIKQIIVEQLGLKDEEVALKAKFVDDLGADSLDLVELVMQLEERYGIEISDEDAETLLTVGDVVDYLQQHPVSKGRGKDKKISGPRIDYSA